MTKVCENHVSELACFQHPEIVSKSYCKYCRNEKNKEWIKNNPTKHKAHKIRKQQKNYARDSAGDYFSKL